jgi:hypothetical protein
LGYDGLVVLAQERAACPWVMDGLVALAQDDGLVALAQQRAACPWGMTGACSGYNASSFPAVN